MKLYKYIPYNPNLKNPANQLRKNMTTSENLVWYYLSKEFPELTINKQKPLDQFIADFYCSEFQFIIEVDGGIHTMQKERDSERDNILLQKYNIKTIRVTNEEVANTLEVLKQRILEAIPPLTKGGLGGI